MLRSKRLLFSIAAAASCAAPLAAQGTNAVSYQGRLLVGGQPVNGSADLRFTLYLSATFPGTAGNMLTFQNQTLIDGLVALELDFGADAWVNPTFPAERYLGIEVRSPAGSGAFVALPRQRMTSAPFSIATRGIRVDGSSRVGMGVPFTNPLLARLHVSDSFPAAFGNHAAVVESRNVSGADGIAIKIVDSRGLIDKENNYVTFLDGADNVAGRIEGFSRAQGCFATPPALPDLIDIDWDPGRLPSLTLDPGTPPSASLSGGALPSLSCTNGTAPTTTFNRGTSPSLSFQQGSSPSLSATTTQIGPVTVLTGFNFNSGTLPSASLSAGTLPSLVFNPGQFPTCTLNPGSLPAITFDPGTPPSGTFDPGQLPANIRIRINIPTQAEMTALICWAHENGLYDALPTLLLYAVGGSSAASSAINLLCSATAICLDQGVIYGSKGADYAEWLPKGNARQQFHLGQVVGIKSGKVTIFTDEAEQLLVISAQPVVLGNEPPDGEKDSYAKVAMMGQVPVLARGKVFPGDYLVPSSLNDGTAIAVAPENLAARHLPFVIGRAWSASTNDEMSLVTTTVGIETFGAAKVLVAQEQLAAERDAELRTENETLRARVSDLEAEQADLHARLAALEALASSLVPAERR